MAWLVLSFESSLKRGKKQQTRITIADSRPEESILNYALRGLKDGVRLSFRVIRGRLGRKSSLRPEAVWSSIALSSDGTKLAAVNGGNGGGIWIFYNGVNAVSTSTTVGTAGLLEGSSGSVIELIYAGGGQFFTLYQNGLFLGH